jgi:hypothetical protein
MAAASPSAARQTAARRADAPVRELVTSEKYPLTNRLIHFVHCFLECVDGVEKLPVELLVHQG